MTDAIQGEFADAEMAEQGHRVVQTRPFEFNFPAVLSSKLAEDQATSGKLLKDGATESRTN